MIKGILFDFGGTLALGDLDKDYFTTSFLEYIRSLGFRGRKSQYEKARKGMFEKLMKARSINREIRLEELYQGLLFKLGLHPSEEVIDYIHQLYIRSFNVELVPGLKEVLEFLKERYSLAVISNSMSDVPRQAIKKFNLEPYFDTVVISRDIGIRKPDSEIFNFALHNLGLESYNAIHVGDSLKEDIQGANNAGIKTIWIQRNSEETHIQPDYTIQSIKEIPSLL